MAAAATVSSIASPRPRYAPEDPSLPRPWKGLIDDTTGFLYFWNPETNVTQYERPTPSGFPSNSAVHVSSSVQVRKSCCSYIPYEEDDEFTKNHDGMKADVGVSYIENERVGSVQWKNGTHIDCEGSFAKMPGDIVGGSNLSAEEYRHRHEITIIGDEMPMPLTSFEATGFPLEILREVHIAGFSAPTPIQAQAWPIVLKKRDIVAIARTGSGKTLGYLIPSFIHLNYCRNNAQLGPTVLVLSPTRELASQIQDEAVKFGKSSRISCTCLYGGAPKGPQLKELERGVDIVVATPGRLNDILEMRRISLGQVSYLVLDEADRMLDMGFEPQIRKIVKEVPTRRQTLMYTATWPKEVRKIAADLLINPIQVNIGKVDELVASKSITQYVEVLTSMEKPRRLEQILRSQEPGSKIIIFCSTKRMCDQLARNLSRHCGATAIHGDKSQGERDHVLNQFRNGRSPVLVATDVAARGLDVKDIRVVINYDFPSGVEDYVHRIGRTGRAGATGISYTFFGNQDAKYAFGLLKVLEGANQQVPQEIRDMASRSFEIGKFRRWGSGSDGCDGGGSGYNTGDGGRSGNRGCHPELRNRYHHDHSPGKGHSWANPEKHPASFQPCSSLDSFHEAMMRRGLSSPSQLHRDRSRSPPRGSRASGHHSNEEDGQCKGRSESPYGGIFSFHKAAMQRGR